MDAHKGHNTTSCSGALQCHVGHVHGTMYSLHDKDVTNFEDDQSSLPMSLVASLDTVPVTCCVPAVSPCKRKLMNGNETVEVKTRAPG